MGCYCQLQAPGQAKELPFSRRQIPQTVGLASWLINMFLRCVTPKINSEEDSAWWDPVDIWYNASEHVGFCFSCSWKVGWRMKPNSHCHNSHLDLSTQRTILYQSPGFLRLIRLSPVPFQNLSKKQRGLGLVAWVLQSQARWKCLRGIQKPVSVHWME